MECAMPMVGCPGVVLLWVCEVQPNARYKPGNRRDGNENNPRNKADACGEQRRTGAPKQAEVVRVMMGGVGTSEARFFSLLGADPRNDSQQNINGIRHLPLNIILCYFLHAFRTAKRIWAHRYL
jgi:hypothetical protein